jgi:hypothetical protein
MVTGPVEFVGGGDFLYAAHPMEGKRKASRTNPLQKAESVATLQPVSR